MRNINRREFIGGAVVPTDGEVKAGGPTFVYRFAPASVTRLQMSLA